MNDTGDSRTGIHRIDFQASFDGQKEKNTTDDISSWDKSKDKSLVTLNTAAVLSEIERLGSGLVSAITVQV